MSCVQDVLYLSKNLKKNEKSSIVNSPYFVLDVFHLFNVNKKILCYILLTEVIFEIVIYKIL